MLAPATPSELHAKTVSALPPGGQPLSASGRGNNKVELKRTDGVLQVNQKERDGVIPPRLIHAVCSVDRLPHESGAICLVHVVVETNGLLNSIRIAKSAGSDRDSEAIVEVSRSRFATSNRRQRTRTVSKLSPSLIFTATDSTSSNSEPSRGSLLSLTKRCLYVSTPPESLFPLIVWSNASWGAHVRILEPGLHRRPGLKRRSTYRASLLPARDNPCIPSHRRRRRLTDPACSDQHPAAAAPAGRDSQ